MAATILVSPFSVKIDHLPGGTQFLAKKARFAPLEQAQKLAVIEYLDEISEDGLSKLVRARPAFILPYNDIPYLRSFKTDAERCAAALDIHRFALEFFAAGAAVPMAAFELVDDKVVRHVVDADGSSFREANLLELPVDAWDKQITYLEFLYGAALGSPSADIIMGRVCRAVREGPTLAGIIDLSIALEALVIAQQEIKFKFALYNSLIFSADANDRTEKFELLSNLYDVRSTIVHGGKMGKSHTTKMKVVVDGWPTLLSIVRRNLTYHLGVPKADPDADWQLHLRDLALGKGLLEING